VPFKRISRYYSHLSAQQKVPDCCRFIAVLPPRSGATCSQASKAGNYGWITSVMMEKFAGVGGLVGSEFLDLNHASNSLVQVTLMISKFAPEPAPNAGELRNRDT
jgi:hypothetical protein